MKKLTAYIVLGFLALFAAAPMVAVTAPASPASAACNDRLLGIPVWYRGVVDGDCKIEMPQGDEKALSGFIWKIVLNVIEMVLVIVVYIVVAFILYGGFLFMTGGGNPSTVEKARKTILNAVIGLAISMASIAIVNLIFRII